jgi:tripeptidyl-peptidase I
MAPSGGTSAACPVWGGLTGLLNDARFKAGLPAMGFLNPWLYSQGEDFLVDITRGAARGCDGINHQNGKPVANATVIPGAYWNATIGWDPATGLGIPDFQKMVQVAVTDVVESRPWWYQGNRDEQENDNEGDDE